MNPDAQPLHLHSRLAHAGASPDPATGAVVAPLHLATTFERAADGSYPHSHAYSRASNPTRTELERVLAQLEQGADAAAFGSGLAAAAAVFQALRPGDHVLAPADVYHGVRSQLRDIFLPWGLAADFVDMTDLPAVAAAIRPNTRLLWLETPSNPLLHVTDLAALTQIARKHGIRTVADNTFATPLLQQPLSLGVDIVMHSTTKYLNGHSDVLGGALVTARADAFWERIRAVQQLLGAVPAPFDAFQLMRGLRSLGARMRLHCDNAMALAEFLQAQPQVHTVRYPGLPQHPRHEVALRQMHGGFGGMLSFQVHGGAEAAMAVAANCRLVTRATSLGGTETLIEHRASVEGPDTNTPQDLLRLSVGLEYVKDLQADLAQALQAT